MQTNALFKKKLLLVKNELARIDPYGLLAGGAPEDEFAREALAIARSITHESGVQSIAEAFASVLNNALGLNDSPALYLSAAQHLHDALQAF